jgi:hypothetical protein
MRNTKQVQSEHKFVGEPHNYKIINQFSSSIESLLLTGYGKFDFTNILGWLLELFFIHSNT